MKLTPAPSAPPQPPLSHQPPLSPPLTFHSEYPTAATTMDAPCSLDDRIPNTKDRMQNISSRRRPGPWSTGLWDCCHDMSSCCLTCWCPCIAFGRIAEIVDRGSTSCGVSGALYSLIFCVTGCSCLYSCFYRSKLRGQYFLNESPCTDCCVHCCCEECALCQEYRELKNMGFDMSIGWHGNMERRKGGALVPPPTEEGMKW